MRNRPAAPGKTAGAGNSPDQKSGITAVACGLADADQIEDRNAC
jgi:hypothetical protein